jgi:hypothetical protein
MKYFSLFIISIPTILFVSCLNTNRNHDSSIEKIWQWDSYIDSVTCYKEVLYFDEDNSGFQFLSDGRLKRRQNASWCGTPPISYETVLGSWNKTSDSTIRLEYPYWGGKIINDILIVKIFNSELQIKSISLQRLK